MTDQHDYQASLLSIVSSRDPPQSPEPNQVCIATDNMPIIPLRKDHSMKKVVSVFLTTMLLALVTAPAIAYGTAPNTDAALSAADYSAPITDIVKTDAPEIATYTPVLAVQFPFSCEGHEWQFLQN